MTSDAPEPSAGADGLADVALTPLTEHDAERYLAAFVRANEACSVREAEIERLTEATLTFEQLWIEQTDRAEAAEAERDRLRAVVERVEALAGEWSADCPNGRPHTLCKAGRLRAALDGAGQ